MKKEYLAIFTGLGVIVNNIYNFLGVPKVTLLFLIVLDYISGFIVAGYFKNSEKTENGALSSKVGYKGLCKKMFILIFVGVGVLLDNLLNLNYVANGVCFAFISNEILSLIENAGLMGFKVPQILKDSVEVLKGKGESKIDK